VSLDGSVCYKTFLQFWITRNPKPLFYHLVWLIEGDLVSIALQPFSHWNETNLTL
jgi:hypothetical protein